MKQEDIVFNTNEVDKNIEYFVKEDNTYRIMLQYRGDVVQVSVCCENEEARNEVLKLFANIKKVTPLQGMCTMDEKEIKVLGQKVYR